MGSPASARQGGIALPIMLIMLTVMMVSSIYLLKSSTSTTLTTSNLAYDAELTRAADAGLQMGFTYLRDVENKDLLLSNQSTDGYVATLPQGWTVSMAAFWNGSKKLNPDSANNRVEYVIHRLCNFAGPYDALGNQCQTTGARPDSLGPRALGWGLGIDSAKIATAGQIHYLVTARVSGPRGGNVVTQTVVMKGP